MRLRPYQFVAVICAAIVAVMSFATLTLAVSVEAVPNPRREYGGWVMDRAELLSPEATARLNQIIDEFEQATSNEIAVVTVPDVWPSKSPQEFATKLFNHWRIGKADKNNGVLFLVARKERRTEIKPGKGLASALSTSRSESILKLHVTPKFKRGDFDVGTIAGVQAIIDVIRESAQSSTRFKQVAPVTSVDIDPETTADPITWFLSLFGLIGVISLFVLAIKWSPGASSDPDRTDDNDVRPDDFGGVDDFGGGSCDDSSGGGDRW